MELSQQEWTRRRLLHAGGLGALALVNTPEFWRRLCLAQAPAPDEFTLLFMTDTHLDFKCSQESLKRASEWIAENARRLNLRYVAHQGDVGDERGSAPIREMLRSARTALQPVVKARIPCSIAIGNHDYDFTYDGRACEAFNDQQAFGMSFYAGQPWFKGTYANEARAPGIHPGGTANHYATQEISGRKFLFLVLEFFPREKVMAWADDLVRKRLPDHEVIVATHAYLNNNGRFIDHVSDAYTGFAGNSGDEYSNHGLDLWNKYFRHWPNLRIVTSGHIHTAPRQCYLATTGVHGNIVHNHFWNHQNWMYRDGEFHPISRPEHQTLMLKLFRIRLSENQVLVQNHLPLIGVEGEPAVPGSYTYRSQAPASTKTDGGPVSAPVPTQTAP